MTRSTEDAPGGPPDAQGQETLAQYLARAGRLPVLQGQALAVQLLAAVDAAHRQGRSHGELSTSNILVNRNGRLLLPEQPEGVVGHPARGPDRDLVDAAKVAFELLTGASPSGRGAVSAPSVRAWRPELPHDVDAVFDRALAGPDGGFRSVARFSQALQAAMPAPHWVRGPVASSPTPQPVATASVVPAQEPVRAPRTASVRRFGPRRVALVACAAFAVLGVAAVAALHPEQWREPTQLRAEVPPPDTAAMGQRSAEQVVPEEPREPAIAPAPPSADVAAESDVAEPAAPEPPPASSDKNAHKTGSRVAAREAKAHASTARQSRRPTRLAVASVDQRWRAGPEEQCRRDSVLAADLCMALRCATSDFRQHPVCVRMHGEAARARARLAEAMGGP